MAVRSLRLALVQMNSTVGALAENAERIGDALAFARARKAEVVVFPELALCGYPPEDLLLAPRFLRDCRRALERLVPQTRGLTAIIGFPEWDEDPYNAAAVLHDGSLVATVRKRLLPTYGVFDEDRYFRPGDRATVIDRRGIRLGISICEDIWFPEGPPALQALHGDAEILVNLSASPYEHGKRSRRRHMLETRAADSAAMVAYVNAVGGQDELVFDGGSLVCDAHGRTLVEAAAFEEGILVHDCVVDGVQGTRLRDTRRRKARDLERPGEGSALDLHQYMLNEPGRSPARGGKSAWHEVPPAAPQSDEAEIYAALVTGLRDYVNKNGFESVLIGLSGGIDSALTAVVAVDALGAKRVHGMTLPSRFSSTGTRSDALALAANLGIPCPEVAIEPVFETALDSLKPIFRRKAWNEAEENLQARIRGLLLMAASNKFGHLVLTTGNKSELSVGYATLYGDMAGGFNVLKDVFKTTVFRLCAWRNSVSPVIPASILTRPPSAELRANQTDQDSLPPYDVLDGILKAYIEEDVGLDEILLRGYDRATVERVLRLVDRMEYKRRQAAPGIKITNRAFGRDRRLPITNRYRPGGE